MLRNRRNSSVSPRPDGFGPTALVKLDRNLLTTDDEPRRSKIQPPKIGRAERDFMRQLRFVAKHVGHLVAGFEAGNAESLPALTQVLRAYADALTPWAVSTVQRMLGEVDARDRDSWRSLGLSISSQLKHELRNTNVGVVARALLHEQVGLIKSLPIEAAERVHELTLRGLEDSTRAEVFAKEIARTGEVTESRAMLIARTEVARTATTFNRVRAQAVGSTHFRWRTSEDSDVRPDHRILNRKVIAWNDPPIADRRTGARALPGEIYNCRCWAEALLPE